MPDYRVSIIVEGQDKASGALNSAGGALGRIGEIAGGILAADMFKGIIDGIANMGKAAIQATADYQAMQVGLESLLARELTNTGQFKSVGDAMAAAQPKAKGLMDELAKVAILSPYQVENVQQTFKLAMAFGYTSDEAKKFTSAILDVAAGTGASNDMMDRMAYNFAQIRLQGKVTAMDVRQLAMAGFDLNGVLKYVGQQMKININNTDDFNAAISTGKITWTQFNDLFAKYAKEQFGGAAERMSRTLNGLKSTLKDVFVLTFPKILGPAAEQVTGFANEILNQFLGIRDSGALDAVGVKLGEVVGNVVAHVRSLFGIFRDMGAVQGFKSLFNFILPPDQAEVVRGIIDQVVAGIGQIGAFIATNGPIVGKFFADLWGQIQIGVGFLSNFLTTQGPAIFNSLNDLIGNLVTKITELASKIIPWLVEKFNQVAIWFTANGPLINKFIDALVKAWNDVVNAVAAMWEFVRPALDLLIGLILNLAKIAMQIALTDWAGAWTTIQTTVNTAWEGVKGLFDAFANWITTTFFGTTWSNVIATWSANVTMFQTIIEYVWGQIKLGFNSVVTTFATVGSDIINGIRDGITGAWNGFIDWVKGLLNGLPGPIKKALGLENWTITVPNVPNNPSKTTTTTTNTTTPKQPIGRQTARAGGGWLDAFQPSWVGERGIELFVPKVSGYVVRNDDLKRLMGPQYNVTIIEQINSALDVEIVTDRIIRRLEELNM